MVAWCTSDVKLYTTGATGGRSLSCANFTGGVSPFNGTLATMGRTYAAGVGGFDDASGGLGLHLGGRRPGSGLILATRARRGPDVYRLRTGVGLVALAAACLVGLLVTLTGILTVAASGDGSCWSRDRCRRGWSPVT